MASVGIRALKNGLSKYLRQLKHGQVLQVTDRGRVIAEIRAAPRVGDDRALTGRFEALLKAGIIRGPIERGDPMEDWPSDGDVKLPEGTAKALLDADRGE